MQERGIGVNYPSLLQGLPASTMRLAGTDDTKFTEKEENLD
jgi:hypothetical protein